MILASNLHKVNFTVSQTLLIRQFPNLDHIRVRTSDILRIDISRRLHLSRKRMISEASWDLYCGHFFNYILASPLVKLMPVTIFVPRCSKKVYFPFKFLVLKPYCIKAVPLCWYWRRSHSQIFQVHYLLFIVTSTYSSCLETKVFDRI